MKKEEVNAAFSLEGRLKFLWVDDKGVHISYNKMMAKGERTIPFNQIVSVEVKKPGTHNGYVYFQTAGSPTAGQTSARDISTNDNCVIFLGEKKYETALKIRDYIEQKQTDAYSPKQIVQEVHTYSTADEILKFKQLLDSGAITQEEFDAKKSELLGKAPMPDKQPQKQEASQSDSPPTKPELSGVPQKKGMNGCLFAFILTASIILGMALIIALVVSFGAGSSASDLSSSTESSQVETSQVLFNASGLGGKTVEELKELFPETEDSGTVDVTMANGETVSANYYSYYKDGISIGFSVIDNKVVSANIMWDEPQSYSGDKTEIIQLIGITPGKDLEEITDTNSAIRWQRVASGISEVWVAIMDSDAKTFSNVKVVYDSAVSGKMPDDAESPDLEVLSYDSTADSYTRYIVGKIRNNTDKTYSYVQVEIGLYKGENLVGSTLDNVNNLGPGQIWEFKAIVLDNDSDNYKITNVTGF